MEATREGEREAHEARPAGLRDAPRTVLAAAWSGRSGDREAAELRFRIEGADGATGAPSSTELHERRMHLIVVRRDGTGFQHLHPEMDAAGTWTVPLEFAARRASTAPSPTSRSTASSRPRPPTSSSPAAPSSRAPFPAPRRVDATAGYEVRLDARRAARRRASHGSLHGQRGGRPVAPRSPTWAPRATWWRCARATSPSSTSTPRRPDAAPAASRSIRRDASRPPAATASSSSSSTTARSSTAGSRVAVAR